MEALCAKREEGLENNSSMPFFGQFEMKETKKSLIKNMDRQPLGYETENGSAFLLTHDAASIPHNSVPID